MQATSSWDFCKYWSGNAARTDWSQRQELSDFKKGQALADTDVWLCHQEWSLSKELCKGNQHQTVRGKENSKLQKRKDQQERYQDIDARIKTGLVKWKN